MLQEVKKKKKLTVMLVEVLKEIEYYCHNSYLERLEVI